MNLQDFVKLLRNRWITVCVTGVLAILGAALISVLTTPLYQATTRLFVSTTAGSTLSEAYSGSRFSQERVASYAELITGTTLAQRTIDKLGLDISAPELRERISASAKLDTVLIDVSVVDESAVRARDVANTLSDEFVAMVRELETPENGSPPDSRVVVEQRASVPEKPVTPKTSRNLAIGAALGLVLGIGIAVVRDMLDNSVKSRETVELLTGAGVVGSIPLSKERRKQPAISFDTDNSGIAEAFRKLRTNLQFLAVDNPPRVIVVTSSLPSEGKSTTSINIALALAEAGNNVLLIDGDLRRPVLHKYLDLVGVVGFSTVLSGAATLKDALQKTRFQGLTVLTAGAIPPNPSELLGSQTAKKLLNELRGQFDYVVVDSTPLLAVTDAAILSAAADGVLLIARFGQTRREQLTQAVESLRSVGAPLLGAVFAMVPSSRTSPYGDNYRYYGTDVASPGQDSQATVKPTAEELTASTSQKRDGQHRLGAAQDPPGSKADIPARVRREGST